MVDEKDQKIIELLKKDSSMTMQEIAKQLGLTRQTVHSRIKTLKNKGIILQYTIITNDKKLGKGVTAMVLVVLDRIKRVWDLTAQELLSRGNELEIVEMHRIAGEYDVAIKIKTRSIETLEAILSKITHMKGVARTHTMICLTSYEYGYRIHSEEGQRGSFFPL